MWLYFPDAPTQFRSSRSGGRSEAGIACTTRSRSRLEHVEEVSSWMTHTKTFLDVGLVAKNGFIVYLLPTLSRGISKGRWEQESRTQSCHADQSAKGAIKVEAELMSTPLHDQTGLKMNDVAEPGTPTPITALAVAPSPPGFSLNPPAVLCRLVKE